MTVLNQYPAYCVTCERRRPENHGPRFRRSDGSWAVSCDGEQAAPAAESKKAFAPSTYQAAIDTALRSTENHLVVSAVAGSGKTTTIEWLMRAAQGLLGKCAYFAFNRDIVAAARERLPSSIRVSTLNSFGAAMLSRNLPKRPQEPEDNKLRILAAELFPVENHPHEEAHRKMQAPLVQLARLERATLANNPQKLAEHYGVDLGEADVGLLFDAVPVLVARARETALTAGFIDYDDQVWLPAIMPEWSIETFDTILLDEGQDVNGAQMRMILRALGRTGRAIMVGDRYQAIYGFRGAGITAFDDFQAALRATGRGAQELPLSICYRCPKVIERLVNEEGLLIDEAGVQTTFLVREDAPEGSIEHLHEKKLPATLAEHVAKFNGKVPNEELLVLCPRNAPLVRPCLRLLCDGVKATIRGRDIGAEIVRLIVRVNPGASGTGRKRKVGQEDVSVMLQALSKHCLKEIEKLTKAMKEAAAEKIADQKMVIEAFAEEAERVTAIVEAIEGVFSESTEGVVFSTVHRAKGLQSNVVYLMEEWNMPFPACKQAWERRQGLNLRYVALTRCKTRLVFVHDDRHAPDDGEGGDEFEGREPETREDFGGGHGAPEGTFTAEYEDACDWGPDEDEDRATNDALMAAEAEESESDEESFAAERETTRLGPDGGEQEIHPEGASLATLDQAALNEVLSKLPSFPSKGRRGVFASPTMTDWAKINDAYAKAGCQTLLHKPARWRQYALDVMLPGVTVRISTTVDGFGETREKGENAIDIVIVDKDGRPTDGATKALRGENWQGRVCERVNALLRKGAKA